MGSRASYVVKRDGQARSYGAHWLASSLVDHLMWGPEYATAAFEAQEPLDELADIEGGDDGYALIDWDERRMIWWMANCYLPAQQRLYNRLMQETWPGWRIALAVHGIDDLFDHLHLPREGEDDPTDEAAEEDAETDVPSDDESDVDEELLATPKSVDGPIHDIEELEPASWLTIRAPDGSWRDYFGFPDGLSDCLRAGESLLARLEPLPGLAGPPPEVVSRDGAIIDPSQRVIWRWEGPRYAWQEKRLARAWKGWTWKDLPGQWQEQLRVTGRTADGAPDAQRQVLGVTVAGLLSDSSIDPRQMLSGLLALGRGLRMGCLGITVAVGLLGAALAMWLKSVPATIFFALLFVICLLPTVWLWRRTSLGVGVLKMMESSPKDTPLPKGLTADEKRQRLDPVLARLGYPSLDQLQAAGELPRGYADDEDEDEDE